MFFKNNYVIVLVMKNYLFFIILTLILIVLLVFVLVLELANLNKIVYGVKITGQKIGGLNFQEAQNFLLNKTKEIKAQKIILKFAKEELWLTPTDLEVEFALKDSLSEAYNLGRKQNIFKGLKEQIFAVFGRYNLPLSVILNQSSLNDFVGANFSKFETPPKNASLVFGKDLNEWETTPASGGRIFERRKLSEEIEKNLSSFSPAVLELKLETALPAVTENETFQAEIQAEQILNNAPFQLVLNENNNRTWPLSKEMLLDWIEFQPIKEKGGNNEILGVVLGENEIKEYLTELAPQINRSPIDAYLTFKDNKVSAFSLEQEGQELDFSKSILEITKGVLEGKKDIELKVIKIKPKITVSQIENLGLTSLLARGTSNFAGSPKNRTHNIKIGAAKFNGILVEPGEEFSFNQNLGEISAAAGYLPELVIKKNKTVPEYGGGLCQVSTTLFRAAVNSGLKITERYPHAFPVKYYNPQGFDATIYPPHPDLRFLNDTPSNILIQTKIQGTELTFEIYGTDDSREVKIKGPYVLESNPDGSMKTILTQEIWRDGKIERSHVFKSNYKSPDLYPIERNPLE